MNKKAGLVWVDAQGERVLHVVTTDTGVGAIESAIESKSNAVVLECWEGDDEVYSSVPSVSNYHTVRVAAVLEFTDGTGSSARVYIPSPDSSIFSTDGDTVDPSQITSIISACIGHLICGSGNVATAFVQGKILRTKLSGIVATSP
jgi:hypothetical protein